MVLVSRAEYQVINLNKRLNVEAVTDVVRQGRLRWFGHLERKENNDWYPPVETLRWWVQNVRVVLGKHGKVCERGHQITWSEDRMGAGQGEIERTHKGKPSNPC